MRLPLFLSFACLAVFAMLATPADAGPGMAMVVAQSVPADSYPGVDNFVVSCADAATPVVSATGKASGEVWCWVDGTTPAFFGSNAVTTSTGFPVCEDAACIEGGLGVIRLPVRRGGVSCIVTTGTVSARCMAFTAAR
jgi:hypothetical protein